MNRPKILIVDDDAKISKLIHAILESAGGYEVREENRSFAALNSAREFRPDLVLLDATSGEVHYANAGHPSPMLIRRETSEIERLGTKGRGHGPALGFMEDAVYRSGSQDLAPHDLVMMFTDGIFEVDGPDEEPYGQERLVEALRRRVGMPPGQIFDEVIEEVHRFSVKEEFDDDVCLLGVEVDHLC